MTDETINEKNLCPKCQHPMWVSMIYFDKGCDKCGYKEKGRKANKKGQAMMRKLNSIIMKR